MYCYDNISGVEDIEVGLDISGETIEEKSLCIGNICGEEVHGQDCGQEVSDWLENVLGLSGVKLVRGVRRKSSKLNGSSSSSSLANDSSCLVLSQASVVQLAEEVRTRCDLLGEDWTQFSSLNLTQRFRANIVVSASVPFQEESWAQFETGGRQFSVSGPCKRCQVIRVEQDTGEVTQEPLRSLAAMKNRAFNFGVHSRPVMEGRTVVAVGDRVSYTCRPSQA